MIISYQLFTQTAVHSIVTFLAGVWPSIGELLVSNVHIIVFIHAFAWIFVLSSVIPSIILGKRSVLLQFLLVLTITLVAMFLENVLARQMQNLFVWFQNPLVAGSFLSAPYLFMLYLDLHSRKKTKIEESMQETVTEYLEEPIPTEVPSTQIDDNTTISPNSVTDMQEDKVCPNKPEKRLNFLHGASVVCFLLAFFTLWFGGTFLNTAFILFYAAFFIALGVILLRLGFYSLSTK